MTKIIGLVIAAVLVGCVGPEESAPPTGTDEQAVAIFADKIEIDGTGKTKCDYDNAPCITADKAKCPDGDGKYSGTCWCTHCEGGNVCETETDHTAHDDKCKLKAGTAADVEAAALE
jgi:hypothetical protein